jgi:hypothetical protein
MDQLMDVAEEIAKTILKNLSFLVGRYFFTWTTTLLSSYRTFDEPQKRETTL